MEIRFDEIAKSIEESMCNHLNACQLSIQLDEFTYWNDVITVADVYKILENVKNECLQI